MSEKIKVIGGVPLSGEVTPVPNKNAILPALCASILSNKTITYKNIPQTTDVIKMLDILRGLGADVDDSDFNNLKINCSSIKTHDIDSELSSGMRAPIMFAGPLLARFGKAKIPLPEGCVLGKRSLGAHVDAFKKAGISSHFEESFVEFEVTKKDAKSENFNIWQIEASVTATENICMYAAGRNSSFTIIDAATEPHVTQLLLLLKDMGAKIEGIDSNKVNITGFASPSTVDNVTFIPEPDFVDIGGLIVACAITKGKITLKDSNIPHVVDGLIQVFAKFNIDIKRKGKDLVVNGTNELYVDPVNSGFPLAGDDLPKLAPRPWPGFPVDVLPVMITLACKTKGKTLIQNWMYESGLDFIDKLNEMGADIEMLDNQKVVVNGPIAFKGGYIETPGIIQATKALFLASLCEEVETTFSSLEVLKRRYPDVIDVYTKLGANITTVLE